MIEVETDFRSEFDGVRDQNPLPTCLAHATSTAHRHEKGICDRLSAETLHFHATGGSLESAISINQIQAALLNKGQPKKLHCEPIPIDAPQRWSPPQDVQHFTSDSNDLTPGLREMANSIDNFDNPVLCITFPENFYDPDPPWILSEGEPVGRHAVVGIGYGSYDERTAILIRNSWGAEWGVSGHVWLDNSFIEYHLEGAFIVKKNQES